jgi:hypothetical protein
MGAIPQLDGDGDVSLGAETASLPATPPPPPPPPPPPSDSARTYVLHAMPLLSLIMNAVCVECLEKLVCKKCFTTASKFRLKYQFFKYMYDYSQVECKI